MTTPRSDVMYLVTEYGMVNLKGKSVAERAKAIICLAHPDFREDLERQAYDTPVDSARRFVLLTRKKRRIVEATFVPRNALWRFIAN